MKFNEIAIHSIENIKDRNYDNFITSENAFKRSRTWSLIDYIIFILSYNGQSTTEAIHSFVENMGWDEDKLITKQALFKQRVFIDPKLFKEINNELIEQIFISEDYKPLFKDYKVLIADGSKAKIPNLREVKKEFDVAPDTEKYTQPARTMFSTIIDAKYGFVLDSILGKSRSSERELLKKHILNIENYIDLNKTIIILDRGYYSLELLLLFETYNMNYIFRLKDNTYIDERNNMKKDEYLNIKLTKNRTNQIKDEKLLKLIENKKYITKRFVNIKLENGTKETLLTNLPPEIANIQDLKELYAKRWEIELNYDKMKNKLRIEEYSGRKEINIQQDFYAKMYLFNIYEAINNESLNVLEDINKNERGKNNKERRPNSNLLIGRIRKKLYSLLTASHEQIVNIFNELIEYGAKFTVNHYFKRKKFERTHRLFIGKIRSNIKRA